MTCSMSPTWKLLLGVLLSLVAEDQTPSVGQSFLSRIVSAITPAKLIRATPTTSKPPHVRGRRELSASALYNRAKPATALTTPARRKRQTEVFKTLLGPSPRRSTYKPELDFTAEGFELQEFSAVRKSGSKASIASSGSDYTDFQAPQNHPSPDPSSFSCTTNMKSPLDSDRTPTPRRSLRIARRRSVNQKFPTLSVLSQVSKLAASIFILQLSICLSITVTHLQRKST